MQRQAEEDSRTERQQLRPDTDAPSMTDSQGLKPWQRATHGGAMDTVIGLIDGLVNETQGALATVQSTETTAIEAFNNATSALDAQILADTNSRAADKSSLAQEQLDKTQKERLRADAAAAKARVEQHLAEIKPGCDWIAAHYDARVQHRGAESGALQSVTLAIHDTPIYQQEKTQEQEAAWDKWNECTPKCATDEGPQHVNCKACLAKTTVIGYCTGNPMTD